MDPIQEGTSTADGSGTAKISKKKKLAKLLEFFFKKRPSVSTLKRKKYLSTEGGVPYDWKEDTKGVWGNVRWRVIDGDLPRLARKMKVFSEHFQEQLSASQIVLRNRTVSFQRDSPNAFDHISLVVSCLASLLESTEVQKKVDDELLTRLEKSRSQDGALTDVSTISDLLQATVGAESRTVGVLKAVNQSVLAPASMELRQTLTMRFPFKDSKNGWHISVRIRDDKTVAVTHERKEEGLANPKSNYSFSWDLVFHFTEDVKEIISVYIRVKEVVFDVDFDEASRKDFLDAVDRVGESLVQVDSAGLHWANPNPNSVDTPSTTPRTSLDGRSKTKPL